MQGLTAILAMTLLSAAAHAAPLPDARAAALTR
jgi:hypothetical protein